jgi:hypothetical protein
MKVRGIKESLLYLNKEVKKRQEAQKQLVMQENLERLAMRTPVDTGHAKASWRISNNQITNDVPYMSQLNDGHSDQAPARFIEATLLADPRIKPAGIIVTYTREELK